MHPKNELLKSDDIYYHSNTDEIHSALFHLLSALLVIYSDKRIKLFILKRPDVHIYVCYTHTYPSSYLVGVNEVGRFKNFSFLVYKNDVFVLVDVWVIFIFNDGMIDILA